MLRVIVELVPFGDESKKKKVGEMVLANDTSGYGNSSNYEGWIAPDEWCADPQMFGRVKGYDRRGNVWQLIKMMIEECLPKHVPGRGEDDLAQRLKKKLGFKFSGGKGVLCGPAKKTKAELQAQIEEQVRRISFGEPPAKVSKKKRKK